MSGPVRRVSILIISKDDPGLRDTLQGISRLKTSMSYEVLVVDASQGRLDDIRRDFPWARWVSFSPLPQKRVSIPEQRNAAVLASTGQIVVFTDANCVPDEDWLEALVGPIIHAGETVVSGGTASRGGPTIHDVGSDRIVARTYCDECATINLAFKREVFFGVGGFDTRFDYGSDVDFSWRVVDAGYRIRYVPEAVVVHDWGGVTTNAKRAFRYGVARARLYKKHPRRLFPYGLRDFYVLAYMVYIIGLPLTVLFWPYPLIIVPLLVRNRGNRPFAVVTTHLIYAAGALRELVRM